MAVRVTLSRVFIREQGTHQIIELREVVGGAGLEDNARSFPIVIGLPEAWAIQRRMKGEVLKRPQTHELLESVIRALGGTLRSVTITDLSEGTFFATLDIALPDGKVIHVDSRPSDAIALVAGSDVPIYVAEHVLEAAMSEET